MTPRVYILRNETGDMGTFGRLLAGNFTCFTGELPWLNNLPSVSCVLAGTYSVVWAQSPRLRRYTYRLLNVPQRAGILKHSANLFGNVEKGYKAQLLGCISLGLQLGFIAGQKALLTSMVAVRRFEEYMEHKPFTLEIANGFNT